MILRASVAVGKMLSLKLASIRLVRPWRRLTDYLVRADIAEYYKRSSGWSDEEEDGIALGQA